MSQTPNVYISSVSFRVPCIKEEGIRFSFQWNGHWLLVYVMNVGGAGDVASNMLVKGSRTGWISMATTMVRHIRLSPPLAASRSPSSSLLTRRSRRLDHRLGPAPRNPRPSPQNNSWGKFTSSKKKMIFPC